MSRTHFTDRRTVLKTIPATAVGGGLATGNAAALGEGSSSRVYHENEIKITAKHDHEAEEHLFELSTEKIGAGWTTFTFDNKTDHTHFVYGAKLPQAAIDAADEADEQLLDFYVKHVTRPFQWLMDDIDPEKEPDSDDLSDKYSDLEEDVIFPPWFGDVVPSGAVGLTSGHTTAKSTVRLDPGEYIVECYVKDDDGEFHSYNGMIEQISVTDDTGGEEPEATIQVSLSTVETGEDEAPRAEMNVDRPVRGGQHTVAVRFEDQQLYGNQLGHDVHLVRLDEDTGVDDVNDWMNWADPDQFISDGSEPGTFLGGVQEILTPALLGGGENGDSVETAYFHVTLNPGAYALVSEVPDPRGKGLLETFSVTFDDVPAIDPVFGYPTTDAGTIPFDLEPDHEVRMLATPPTDGQPPFLYYDPVGIQVETGDIVQFTAITPDHTVTAFHPGVGPDRRVPEAALPFSSPVLGPNSAWLYRFEHEGVYDVYCGPHFVLGMVMRLVAGDIAEEDLPDYARSIEGLPTREQFSQQLNKMSEQNEDCEWPFLLPGNVLGADSLDPMHIQDEGTVPFSAVAEDLGYEFEPAGEGNGDGGGGNGDGDSGNGDGGDGDGQGDGDQGDESYGLTADPMS